MTLIKDRRNMTTKTVLLPVPFAFLVMEQTKIQLSVPTRSVSRTGRDPSAISARKLNWDQLEWSSNVTHLSYSGSHSVPFQGKAMGSDDEAVYMCSLPCFLVVMGTAGLILLIQLTQWSGTRKVGQSTWQQYPKVQDGVAHHEMCID